MLDVREVTFKGTWKTQLLFWIVKCQFTME